MKRLLERAKEAKTELEMTAMIDVVFLLLIFFMCATKFKIPEGALRCFLPRDRGNTSTSPVLTKNCRITLYKADDGETMVMADDKVIVNDTRGEYEQQYLPSQFGFSEERLEQHLLFRKQTYTGFGAKGLPVIIDFSKEVPFKYVVQVLNICRRVEIEDIGFAMPEIPLDGN